jgi:CubicO group peptidase (beta-lactamase class C family)
MNRIMILLCSALCVNSHAQFSEFASLDSLFDQTFDPMGPGVSVEIAKEGVGVYDYKAGFANLGSLKPVTDKSLFGVASISKQFTAAGIYILETQGKLSVDDDIQLYLLDFPFYVDTIRIKHLLHQTSGIRNTNVLEYLSGDADGSNTNDEVYELLMRQQGVNNFPGFRMLYSNSNYVLLAMIIEKVSGKSFPQFMDDQLFLPLGMESAFFVSEEQRDPTFRVSRYIKTKDGFAPRHSGSMVVGPGGMGCATKDLMKWANVFSNDYSFDADLKDFLIFNEPLNSGRANAYKRGVFESNYQGHTVVHHSGRTEGSRSQLICVPAINLSVVLCAGTNAYNLEAMSYEVLDFFLGEKEFSEETTIPSQVSFPMRLLGNYQEVNSDLGMSIYNQNDTLFAKSSFGAEGVALVAIDALKYTRHDNRSVTYTFTEGVYSCHELVVDFSGAIFSFQKVELVSPSEIDFEEFAGNYHSEELGVNYQFNLNDEGLMLSFASNLNIPLHACRRDEFGSFDRTLFSFDRSDEGEIVGFYLASEGTVFNIYFQKTS